MTSELILWAALGVLIAMMALAVWAGRRGLHALGVVGPGPASGKRTGASDPEIGELVSELHRLNGNLERLIDVQEQKQQEPNQYEQQQP
ncbi:MAG: hypothetical protein AB8B88_08380 [Devosiaceae bacterium]